MILQTLLTQATRQLREAGIEGAQRDARVLIAHAVGIPADRVTLEAQMDVSAEQASVFKGFCARRIEREPVSKIVGKRQFWGRDFKVTPDVLDPRPETETLIAAALEHRFERLLDLGTGTGCIPITLLAEQPMAQGLAVDVSQAALEVAQENASFHEVEQRLALGISDWFSGVEGRFDLIVSNPPYITDDEMEELSREVREHDPHIALTPGGDGLEPYRVIARDVDAYLEPGGRLLVEIGWKQGAAVKGIFESAGLRDCNILSDLDGRDRVVSARSPV